MPSLSAYLENALLNHVLGGSSYTKPSALYVALFTSDPTESGTAGTEVSGGGYARKTATFSTSTAGSINTNADVIFNVATASWGTVTHIGVFDALTGGNMLFHGALTTSKPINTDDQFKITSTNLTITLD